MESSTAQTSRQQFDGVMYQAALAFQDHPSYYKRVFTTKGVPCDPSKAAPVWVQVNPPKKDYPLKKANNLDIAILKNIQLDFEYPADPGKVHQLGIALADKLVEQGLAESGLPVEDSGAGCHIVIPIVAVDVAAAGGGELVNRAVAEIVNQFIKPEFEALAAGFGLSGLVKLEGFDISRILSTPGTWRPGGGKPNEVAFLIDGYMRRWLAPFTGNNYPVRNESEALAALVKAVCISLETEQAAQETVKAEARSKPAALSGSSNGKHDISPADWLSSYYSKKDVTGDRSHDFNSLVWACYLRFDAHAVETNAALIDQLTGGKYGRRAETEALRSLRKAERLPKVNRADWYASRAYQYPEERATENKGYVEATSIPPSEPPAQPANVAQQPFKQHHLTDLGNARRLVERFGQDMRYVKELGWMCYNGRCWERDNTGMAKRLAKQTVATIYTEAGQIEDDEKRKAVATWATKSEASGKLEAMLTEAESEIEMVAKTDDFDKDPMLLNCLNGTVDLRNGYLRPHRREDLITKLVPVEYQQDAQAPLWHDFLDKIMGDSRDLVNFVQRALGYSMTGDISEHVLFFCYGTGANGKTTLLDVIAHIMGDYYRPSDFTTFLENNNRNGSASPDLARLAGARFVTASEPDPGKRLAEGVLKQLTGGDRITAAYKYKDHFEFTPDLKLWIAANHKPSIRGQDEGIWRRIRLIPFEVTIPAAERDRKLVKKLIAEAPGILAWLVQGCLLWQFEGLQAPEQVMQATEAYRNESDILRDFLTEKCNIGKNNRVYATELYKSYTGWCEESGERPLARKAFNSSMAERGLFSKPGHANKYIYEGISLIPKPEKEDLWDEKG